MVKQWLKFKYLFWVAFITTVLILAFVIWNLQPEWPVTVLSFLVLILVYGIVYFVHLYLEVTRSKKFIRELDSLTQGELDSVNLLTQRSVEELRKQWKEALEKLKASHVGRRKDPLYYLPWFIIMGEPASGKSTAIRQSGAEFPMGEPIQGTGGTRNCDWWFSDRFIMLDTAGRYTMEVNKEADRSEWSVFLKLLARYRKKLPINGIILAIPAEGLVKRPLEQIQDEARRARSKIDQITQELGLRVPVFILVTKCDLINGFTEFFAGFPEEKHFEALGWTNDRMDLDAPDETFGGAFQTLMERFERYRISILEDSDTSVESIQPIFSFPDEFRQLQKPLSLWMESLFQSNPYFPSPFFRGFYLTSGHQVGTVVTSLLDKLGFPSRLKTFSPETRSKSYFLRDFFTRILVRDQNLASKSALRLTKERRSLRFLYGGACIGLLLLVAGMSASFFLNLNQVGGLKRSVGEFQKAQRVSGNIARLNHILYGIGRDIERLDEVSILHPARVFGFHADRAPASNMKSFYLHHFEEAVLNPTLNSLVAGFSARPGDTEERHLDYEEMILRLRAYGGYLQTVKVELTRRGVPLSRISEAEFDSNKASNVAPDLEASEESRSKTLDETKGAKYEPSAGSLSKGLKSNEHALTPNDYYWMTKLWQAKTRSVIQELKENLDLYLALQNSDRLKYQYYSRRDSIDNNSLSDLLNIEYFVGNMALSYDKSTISQFHEIWHPIIISNINEIPIAFSKSCFNEKVRSVVNSLIGLQASSELDDVIRSDLEDKAVPEFVGSYSSAYINTWYNHIKSINLDKDLLRSIDSEQLIHLISSGVYLEPLHRIIENTYVADLDSDEVWKGFAGELKKFEAIHKYQEIEGKYKSLVEVLVGRLSRIVGIPNQEVKFSKIKTVFFPQAEDEGVWQAGELSVMTNGFLSTIDNAELKTGLQNLLEFPILVQQVILVREASKHLQALWEASVHLRFAKDISGRFPFGRFEPSALTSCKEADMVSVINFFHPETGSVAGFLEEAFPFISLENCEVRNPSWLSVDGVMGPLSSEFLNQWCSISNYFFLPDGGKRKHTLVFETELPKALSRGVDERKDLFVTSNSLEIRCDPEKHGVLRYFNGPKAKKGWLWELGSCERAGIEARYSTKRGRKDDVGMGFTGHWSLLKLLRAGEESSLNLINWHIPVNENRNRGGETEIVVPYHLRASAGEDPRSVPFQTISCPSTLSE